MQRKKKLLKRLLLSLLSLLVFWLLAELGFNLFSISDKGVRVEPYPYSEHKLYGKTLGLSGTFHATRIAEGRTLYDATYTIDASRQRTTAHERPDLAEKFFVFLGCSMTFGEGLNDQETLPFLVQQIFPDYHVYNWAFPGYGPGQFILQLQDSNYLNTLKEKSGLFIYSYFGFHRSRFAGSTRDISWAYNFPYFFLNKKKELVYSGGNFSTHRPWTTKIYQLISHSYLMQYFGLSWPDLDSVESSNLICAAIKKMKDQILELSDKNRLLILLSENVPREDRIVEDCLLQEKIEYFDIRKSFDKEYRISPPLEKHYNGTYNKYLAEKLSQHLKQVL